MPLTGDPGWAVAADEGHLVVSAGADAVWVVEDVPAAIVAFLQRYWGPNPPTDADVPDTARPVVEHLAGLGALRPGALARPVATVQVAWIGDPAPAFEQALTRVASISDEPDLVVVARTTEPLRALAKVAEDLATTGQEHVLCDLAFHHTLSLGPYVVPGDTSCLACLAGRVGTRWGDPDPPRRPAATAAAELAALLVGRWLADRAAGTDAARLANATVSFDLETFTTTREPLWRVPGCPVCGEWQWNGRVELPWVAS